MQKLVSFILLAIVFAVARLGTVGNPKKLAPTPPMGWNSWDCYGTTVTEAEVKANADYMAKHLKAHGWQYIVVDIQWYEPNAKAHGYRSFARLDMDEFGRLIPAVNRFPSASGGQGFKPLADYIHGLGLKFGIHIMRGIPRQAVAQNVPIKNSAFHAREIADTLSICPWNTDMYGLRADTPGGQAYYHSILELYNEWGVDYIKADDMTAFDQKPADDHRLNEIKMLSKAIRSHGRAIVLSLSPGPASPSQAEFLQDHAQLWRISDDFWDKWDDIVQQFDFMQDWQNHIGPASWPDADMLPLGKIGIRAERGDHRSTRFTRDEQITLMSLWSIYRSPLMFGGNLPGNDSWTLSLITNDEVLAVNQASVNNRQVYNRKGIVAWTAAAPGTDDVYLAVFNATDSDSTIILGQKQLDLEQNRYRVRDLWLKKEIPAFKDSISLPVHKHGARLLKLSSR